MLKPEKRIKSLFFSILDENNLESAITGNIPVRLQQIENVVRNAGFTQDVCNRNPSLEFFCHQ